VLFRPKETDVTTESMGQGRVLLLMVKWTLCGEKEMEKRKRALRILQHCKSFSLSRNVIVATHITHSHTREPTG